MNPFIVRGQGIFFFKPRTPFYLYNEDQTDGLLISDEKLYRKTEVLIDKPGIVTWFSLDAQNQIVFAGNGEARIETAIYSYQFEKTMKPFLESIVMCTTPEKMIKDPITRKVALRVKATCTLHEIAHGAYMPKSHLSFSSQRLYDCIYSTTLNTPDFGSFSKAIDYSIVTPGCWCHEKLKEKASEFGKPNINETYLRITLGRNNGESPGIPYVMEIWPVNHYSPIHSHGNSEAIIHVLRGKINVGLYASLQSPTPFAITEFEKGDITWINDSLNQTHRLENKGRKTCVTLQCYTYTDNDNKHYDYFDYIEQSGEIKQYTPDSDMDYIEFKKQMQKEWSEIGLFKKMF